MLMLVHARMQVSRVIGLGHPPSSTTSSTSSLPSSASSRLPAHDDIAAMPLVTSIIWEAMRWVMSASGVVCAFIDRYAYPDMCICVDQYSQRVRHGISEPLTIDTTYIRTRPYRSYKSLALC